ncbi:MAG: Flp pilus assembly protein CpaB [Planctomycetaceae bacterium]
MKLTPWLLTVAAFVIVAALAAGFFVKKLWAAQPEPVAVETRQQVPMAVTDIRPGTVVQRQHLGLGPAAREEVNQHRDTILSIDTLVGRIAREAIPAAVPLRASYFYPAGEGPELTVSNPDMRAVAVNVQDETEMVSGLIKPGNHVDVFMTVDRQPTTGGRVRGSGGMLLKLFDGVKVLAIDGRYTPSQNSNREQNNVVLELTQRQQEIMVLAKSKGEISLTFNPNGPGNGGVSVESSRQNRVTLDELLGIEDTDDSPFVTEQFRDGGRADAFYDEDGRPVRRNGDVQGGGTQLQNTGSYGGWSTTSNNQDAVNMGNDRTADSRSMALGM